MEERKTFTYDGMNSADFDLYIAGDSVYDAPTRDIDMITIPGRNGQLSIDQGRFENITVTYPCFIWADTQEEFRTKVRAIRNWLCAKTSYFKLSDEYNPESYRLGIYKSGLEVEPIFYNRAGRFELSFDCKPQRFLFSGEEVFTLGEWGETETYSGSIASFYGTETTAVKSLKVNITPKQSGTGDPSPSNVRPISGWDAVAVNKSGVNIWDGTQNSGKYWSDSGVLTSLSGNSCTNKIVAKEGASYYFGKMGATITVKFFKGNTLLSKRNFYNAISNRTLTAPSGTEYMIVNTGLATMPDTFYINYPSTDTEYHPYNGQTITTNLGQTVYGGVLDVVSGKLTITHEIQNLKNKNSNYTVEYTVNNKRGVGFNYALDKASTRANGWCDHSIVTSETNPNLPQYMWFGVNSKYIFWVGILDVLNMTLEEFKTWQSSHDVYVVDELATPIEVTLTPTEVKTLLGNNNIFADSGDVTVEIGENPYILVNPTKFEATPIFEVEGSGTLTVNNSSMTIANNGTTIIDSEMMEAYEEENGAIISRNGSVSGEFPTLKEGNNNIETVGLTSVKITPKWYEV